VSGRRQTGACDGEQGFAWRMADLAFVLLTIAVFAVLALVVKGVERL
jgi:hypothetical protein